MIWQQQRTRTEAVDEAGDLAAPPAVSSRLGHRKIRVMPRNAASGTFGSESVSGTAKQNPSTRHRSSITSDRHLQILLVASVLVAALVMGVRYLGMLQPSELQAYDHLM